MGGEFVGAKPLLSGRFKTITVEFYGGRPRRRHCYADTDVLLTKHELKLLPHANMLPQDKNSSNLSVPTSDVLGCHLLRPQNSGKSWPEKANIMRLKTVGCKGHCCPRKNIVAPSGDCVMSGEAEILSSLTTIASTYTSSSVCVYLALVIYSDPPNLALPERKRVYVMVFDKYTDGVNENIREAEQWQRAITRLARDACCAEDPSVLSSEVAWQSAIVSPDASPADINQCMPALYQKNFVVFINPSSGAGHAMRVFQQEVLPVFREALINCRIVLTEHAQQAFEMIQCLDLDHIHALVIVSGDGLIFEVINGLMLRSDADQVISILPIAHIPGGSGNGLAANVEHRATGLSPKVQSATHCAVMIARCYSTAMDIFRVELCDNSVIYGFLSLSFGLVADIDIESENLRFTGGNRFFLYSLYRIMKLKRYRACVSYLPPAAAVAAGNQCNISSEHNNNGLAENMPPLAESLPPEWVTLPYEDFHTVLVSCVSHLASNVHAAPEAAFDDGLLHLITLRRDAPRSVVMKFLFTMESGEHLKHAGDYVFRAAASAVRITPLGAANTHVVVDGEKVKYGPTQMQVMPRKARVMVHKPLSTPAANCMQPQNVIESATLCSATK